MPKVLIYQGSVQKIIHKIAELNIMCYQNNYFLDLTRNYF